MNGKVHHNYAVEHNTITRIRIYVLTGLTLLSMLRAEMIK